MEARLQTISVDLPRPPRDPPGIVQSFQPFLRVSVALCLHPSMPAFLGCSQRRQYLIHQLYPLDPFCFASLLDEKILRHVLQNTGWRTLRSNSEEFFYSRWACMSIPFTKGSPFGNILPASMMIWQPRLVKATSQQGSLGLY